MPLWFIKRSTHSIKKIINLFKKSSFKATLSDINMSITDLWFFKLKKSHKHLKSKIPNVLHLSLNIFPTVAGQQHWQKSETFIISGENLKKGCFLSLK